jgi:cytochrome c oxidase subunit II
MNALRDVFVFSLVRFRPLFRGGLASFSVAMLVGCTGTQSALDPAGRGAVQIADLFWGMTIGAVVVWGAVVVLTIYAIRARHDAPQERRAKILIIGGGALFPTVVLAGLLIYGLAILPGLMAPAPPGSLKIHVTGEQWWWRVRYHPAQGNPVDLANEIRVPIGEPVEFELDSPDVIHSFWIPALGGKMDMIPGRRTRLVLEPTRVGTFRGVCAEFCGTSHALMAFDVVVMERAAFKEWLEGQRRGAEESSDVSAIRGRDHFFANGCASCHAIRGTEARGFVGPDLTHVGSRLTIGAGTLRNDPENFVSWIQRTTHAKPGVLMPHFGMLPREELHAIAAYLESLQ